MAHSLIQRALLFLPSLIPARRRGIDSTQIRPGCREELWRPKIFVVSQSPSRGGDSETPNPGQERRMAAKREESPMPCPARDDQMNTSRETSTTLLPSAMHLLTLSARPVVTVR